MVQPAKDQSQQVMCCTAISMKHPASLPTRSANPLVNSGIIRCLRYTFGAYIVVFATVVRAYNSSLVLKPM